MSRACGVKVSKLDPVRDSSSAGGGSHTSGQHRPGSRRGAQRQPPPGSMQCPLRGADLRPRSTQGSAASQSGCLRSNRESF